MNAPLPDPRDRRSPTLPSSREIAAGFVVCAVFPLAFWSLAHPVLAAVAAVTLLGLLAGVAYLVVLSRRLRDRRCLRFELVGDVALEVRIDPDASN